MRSRNEYAWKVGFGLFGMTDGELGHERRSAIFIDVRNVDLSLASYVQMLHMMDMELKLKGNNHI